MIQAVSMNNFDYQTICLVFNFFLIHYDKMTVIWQCNMVSI